MLRRLSNQNTSAYILLAFLLCRLPSLLGSQEPPSLLDPSKHITIDQIKPGMKAYCLTVYEGTKIEKFELEVVSVIKNFDPGLDIILVKGLDDRFIYTGAVAGCSGSPVYIEGRLAGALALGWPYSKDPLYGVTPIENMLQVGTIPADASQDSSTITLDLSEPINLINIEKQLSKPFSAAGDREKMTFLPSPLVVSGIPASVCDQLNNQLSGFGIIATPGFAGSVPDKDTAQAKIEPGSVLAVPVVSGDIEMAVIGTATEVLGNKVYGFGHAFLGYGPVEMPLATGQVHTVVASRRRSFKLATPIDIVGTITADQSHAVLGTIGKEPEMIPLNINIKRYNAPSSHAYNCKMVDNRTITPLVARFALLGAVLQLGSLPPDHTIIYRLDFETDGYGTISFKNASTGTDLDEISTEINATVGLLMNNPYSKIGIKALNCDIEITNKSSLAHIYSATLSDYIVKPGSDITVDVAIEKFRGPKENHSFTLNVPKDLEPGKYKLLVAGGLSYQNFLVRAVPQKLIADNAGSLVEAIKFISGIKRNNLHCILPLPEAGITIQRAELPLLPPTKTLVLTDPKRTLDTQTYKQWLEKSAPTDTVIIDDREIEFEVRQ